MQLSLCVALLCAALVSANNKFDVAVDSECVNQGTSYCLQWKHTGDIEQDGAECFPADVLVSTQSGSKRMDELAIGDAVMGFDAHSGKITETDVAAWLHVSRVQEAKFLQIVTVDGRKLEVSPDHSVAVWQDNCDGSVAKCTTYRLAKTVAPGTKLINHKLSAVTVASVRPITKAGIYAPYTSTATFVVNDFIVHAFANLEEPQVWETTFSWLMKAYALVGEHEQPTGDAEYVHPVPRFLATMTQKATFSSETNEVPAQVVDAVNEEVNVASA